MSPRRKRLPPVMPWLEDLGGLDIYEGSLRQRAMNGPPLADEHRATDTTCPCAWCEPPTRATA